MFAESGRVISVKAIHEAFQQREVTITRSASANQIVNLRRCKRSYIFCTDERDPGMCLVLDVDSCLLIDLILLVIQNGITLRIAIEHERKRTCVSGGMPRSR